MMLFYLRLIWTNFWISFKEGFSNPFSALVFILGKILRFVFFLLFFFFIFQKVKPLRGYNLNDLIFFYLVFVLLDSLSQFLGRGAYLFDNQLINGGLDYSFLYPANDIFLNLFNYLDPLDFITIPIFFFYFIYFVNHYYYWPNLSHLIAFIIIFIISILTILAIYLIAISTTFLTMASGSTLWIWRNLSKLGQVPTQIYPKGVVFFLLYILPVTIIINGPALTWQNRLSWSSWFIFLLIETIIIIFSLLLWQGLKKHYQSVSS